MNAVCTEDCFHCPYPDCVRDDLTAATYAELALLEKTIINPPTLKQRKLAAKQRAYYEANRDKWREYNRRSRAKKKALAADATADKGNSK